jgi:hypothetical protein
MGQSGDHVLNNLKLAATALPTLVNRGMPSIPASIVMLFARGGQRQA